MVMNSRPVKLLRRAWSKLRGTTPAWEQRNAARSAMVASAEDRRITEQVRPFTMTNPLRVHALLDAVDYVIARGVPGAFVECGVWRGGSVMAMVLKLKQLGVSDRDVYLYDTFEGMTAPTAADTSPFESSALSTWQQAQAQGERAWEHLFDEKGFSETQVRDALVATGYPAARLHFVKGPVEQTLPGVAPAAVALLRLDTDWYESTRHELEHLYPRLSGAGVLIIDDYGHWEGARRAVDEYFAGPGVERPLLNRIDYTARIAVKA
jgi:O-methyltransferase